MGFTSTRSCFFALVFVGALGCGSSDGGGNDGGGASNSGATGSGASSTGATGSGASSTGGTGNLAVCDECEACVEMLMQGEGDIEECATICQACEDGGTGGTGGNGGSGNTAGTGSNHIPENDCITEQTCNFNSDCSDGYHCNSVVNQCFDPDPVASVVLECDVVPCMFNSDCPMSWSCSTSTKKCFVP